MSSDEAKAQGRHHIAGRLFRLPYVACWTSTSACSNWLELVEFDRSPLTDIKHCGPCDIGLIEGGLCNAENVHVLREFRKHCKILVAVGACAINGGLPAQRNHLALSVILDEVYQTEHGLGDGGIPNDPELPLPLDKVHPIHEVVQGRLLPPGLSALGRRDLEVPHRPAGRPRRRAWITDCCITTETCHDL